MTTTTIDRPEQKRREEAMRYVNASEPARRALEEALAGEGFVASGPRRGMVLLALRRRGLIQYRARDVWGGELTHLGKVIALHITARSRGVPKGAVNGICSCDDERHPANGEWEPGQPHATGTLMLEAFDDAGRCSVCVALGHGS